MRSGLRWVLVGVFASTFAVGCSDRLSLDGFPTIFGEFEGSDDPGAPTPAEQTPLGLDSAVGGDGVIRIEWRAPSETGPVPELAILLEDEAGAPLGQSPYSVVAGTTHLVIAGFANGQLIEAQLGLRPSAGEPYSSVGQTLSVRTGAPMYVDVAAAPGGSGTSPGSPINDLILAVLIVFSNGGGNLWVAAGEYEDVSLPLFAGVDIYGGFAGDFDLASRDTVVHPTRFNALPDLPVASLLNAGSLSILDGIHLLGNGIASIGIEVEDSPFEGRKLKISDCKRGIKLRRGPFADSVDMLFTACHSTHNELQGLSGEGPLKIYVDGCSFTGNGQEGLEMAAWLAPEGETLRMDLRDCSFTGNGGEGLDVDMIAPVGAGTIGGKFSVNIESCDAQTNGLAGFLLDVDYELAPAWSAEIEMSGCYARANGGAGISLDLDSTASVLVHRASCSANRSHGLEITSETHSGSLTVSSSAFVGNQGMGIHSSSGNFGVLASQCLVAGNQMGGIHSSPGPVSIVSSVAYLQPLPWTSTSARFVVDQPLADPDLFLDAPRGFVQIHAVEGDRLTLSQGPSSSMDAVAEVSDDSIALDILSIAGTVIVVSAPPENVFPPQPLAFFAPGSDSIEDYQLAPSSMARDAGLPPVSGGTSDAGPHGSLHGGIPGAAPLLAESLFHCAGTSPSWVHPISSTADIQLRFAGGVPDPVSAPLFVEVVDANEDPITVSIFVADDLIHLTAPAGGWPQGTSLRLHERLTSVARRSLAAPVIIPLQIL